MKVDSHAHLYPDVGAFDDWDFDSKEEMLRLQQRACYTFAKSGNRSDTGKFDPDSHKVLWDESKIGDWDGLQDVGFRIEGNNFVWEKDGITYTSIGRPASDPLFFLSLMDACGVDTVVIQPPLPISRYVARMARTYPGRFFPLAIVDESDYATEKGIQKLHEFVALGAKGVYYNAHVGWDCFENFESPKYTPFWKEVARLKLPVWSLGSAVIDNFPGILTKLRKWVNDVPDLTRIMVHGFPPKVYMDGDKMVVPQIVKDIMANPRFSMEMLPYAMQYYTHPRSNDMIHVLYDEFGPTRFAWGSEFIKGSLPHTKEHYNELMCYFAAKCPFMSKQDVDLILGDNLARVLHLQK